MMRAMTTNLIAHGAAGRMGRRILALAIEESERFNVVGGVDRDEGTLRNLG